MGFLTVRFPDTVDAVGGPTFSTTVTGFISGVEIRNQNRATSRHRYNVSSDFREAATSKLLDAFFRKARGRAHAFRFKDWADFELATTDSDLVATGLNTWQIYKVYGADEPTFQESRKITKPVNGTVAVYKTATPITAGAGAGQWALNYSTGVFTFVDRDATRSVTGAWTVGATTTVTLTGAIAGAQIGDQLYFTGVTGASASLINNVRLTITNIATATYTFSFVSTGYVFTSGTGTAHWIYKETEDLLVSCEFDVPVRFDFDEKRADLVSRDASGAMVINWNNIDLIEVPFE